MKVKESKKSKRNSNNYYYKYIYINILYSIYTIKCLYFHRAFLYFYRGKFGLNVCFSFTKTTILT